VAFDVRGGRLGRGRGWYDRLLTLPAARGAWKAGLAFACQLTPQVPMGPCDVRMDGVVTEDGLAGREGAGLGGT
jgi:5-formyltetrahydrofolate cyclo-ligase